MPDDTKRVQFGYSRRKDAPRVLKIETPFGCVTVHGPLTTAKGVETLRVDIEPNGERFAGEAPVYLRRGDTSRFGCCAFMDRRPVKARKARGVKAPAPGNTRPDAPSRRSRAQGFTLPALPIEAGGVAPTPERGEPGA